MQHGRRQPGGFSSGGGSSDGRSSGSSGSGSGGSGGSGSGSSCGSGSIEGVGSGGSGSGSSGDGNAERRVDPEEWLKMPNKQRNIRGSGAEEIFWGPGPRGAPSPFGTGAPRTQLPGTFLGIKWKRKPLGCGEHGLVFQEPSQKLAALRPSNYVCDCFENELKY